MREIIDSTHAILYSKLRAISWLLFPSPLWQWQACAGIAQHSPSRWKNGGGGRC